MERALVTEAGLTFSSYDEVLAGPLHGVHPLRMIASLVKLLLGTLQSLVKLSSIRPAVILLTGGWANLPVALSARILGIPIVIYLPDIEPGLTIKVLQPLARVIAITVEVSARHFPSGKAVVTGYPLQANRLGAKRDFAREHFKLDQRLKTLLVFGGSHGARNINVALVEHLQRLLDDGIQIIHITGEHDWGRTMEQLGSLAEHRHYHPFSYLHDDMGLAFAAADLVLCRAGASTLAELPLFSLPAILVPYPYAWHYQKVNADYLSERGAAIHLEDQDLSAKLYERISELLSDEQRLSEMQACSRALAQPNGARELADLLLATGGA